MARAQYLGRVLTVAICLLVWPVKGSENQQPRPIGAMPEHVTDTSTSALVTYVHNYSKFSQKHPGVAFLLSTFESWRRSVGHYPKRKFDLVAITSEYVAVQLQSHATAGRICQFLSLDSIPEEGSVKGVRVLEGAHIYPHSQCWILTHAVSGTIEWSTFPLAHDVVHLATKKLMSFVSTMGYEMLAKVPVGTIVTPMLPTYIPKKLTFSRSVHLWQEDTRKKLKETAASLMLKSNSSSEIGDVWIGHSGDVVALAAAVNEVLKMIVENSFQDEKGDWDLSIEEWLHDIDWEDQMNPDTRAGSKPWNIGNAVVYATNMAASHFVDEWQWDDQVAPLGSKLKTAPMKDVVMVAPRLNKGEFAFENLLRNTKDYCVDWHAGLKGEPGTAMHYAGLIACQASETKASEGENRYAATLG